MMSPLILPQVHGSQESPSQKSVSNASATISIWECMRGVSFLEVAPSTRRSPQAGYEDSSWIAHTWCRVW